MEITMPRRDKSTYTDTVLEHGTKRTWKIPCVATQGETGDERHDEQYVPPPEPAYCRGSLNLSFGR
jgi:hypothetical protein